MSSYRILRNDQSQRSTRFVVVDDNEEILLIWRRVIAQEEQCVCFLTTEASEALREIEAHGADILITDLSMPEMNGAHLARMAKELLPELEIFFTTGDLADFEWKDAKVETPEVLQKPYEDIHHVQAFIHDVAAHHQPQDRHLCQRKGSVNIWHL